MTKHLLKALFISSAMTTTFALATVSPAGAQTALGPPPGIQSEEAIESQALGDFPPLPTPRPLQGGLIRESWAGSNAPTDGVESVPDCGLCVHHVRLGVGTGATLILPQGEVIARHSNGQPIVDYGRPDRVFGAQRGQNMLYVTARENWGGESSIQVYTESGRVFVFRVQMENVLGATPPHLAYEITPTDLPDAFFEPSSNRHPAGMEPDDTGSSEPELPDIALPTSPLPASSDDEIGFMVDITKTYGHRDYEVWGSEEGMRFQPELIYRDDQFTYIQFDEKTWKERPYMSAFITLEGIDQVINSQPFGRTIRVDHVAELITLKFGTSYICIRYLGEA